MTYKRVAPTKAQLQAMKRLWERHNLGLSFLAFRRRAFLAFGDCFMVPDWCGMTIGIEVDGLTHS